MKLAPKVQILLSTFNGEKYLIQQVESILNQDYPSERLKLSVRDDGSQDSTVAMLDKYAKRWPQRIAVTTGNNIGYIKSFAWLLKSADASCDFWGFSDQDDVWFPQKVRWAVEKLSTVAEGQPALYSSFAVRTDSNLAPMPESSEIDTSGFQPTFKNALVECAAQGCTIMFNAPMKELILRGIDRFNIGHDYLSGLISTALNSVIYDPRATLYWRRHDRSTTKNGKGFKYWIYRLRLFHKYYANRTRLRQTEEFLDEFNTLLTPEVKEQAERFCDRTLRNRVRSLICPPFIRKNAVDQLLFKILLLFNRL